MELRRTEQGFALYKEKDCIGECRLSPAPKGAQLAALCILPRWRRKGYGSYLLKEVLRSFGGYDREAATVFTAPLPENAAELAFWSKFGFAAEGGQLVRRRIPDLTAVKFVQDFLAARLVHPQLCVDATCGNGGDTAFLCNLTAPAGRVLAFDVQPEAIRSTRTPAGTGKCARRAVRAHLRQPRRLITVCAARHRRCSHVQLWLAAGGRPCGILHRAEQHPRLAGSAAGSAPRRHRERHPVQRGGHRLGRKTGGAAFSAGTSTEKFHRSGV